MRITRLSSPLPEPKFYVGQFVTYDCTNVGDLAKWYKRLNGSIGRVIEVHAVTANEKQLNHGDCAAWWYKVNWLLRMTPGDDLGVAEWFDEALLREIPAAEAVTDAEHDDIIDSLGEQP